MLRLAAMIDAAHSGSPFCLDPASGLVVPSRQVPSPNADRRPDGVAAELIVVHCISLPPGEFGGGHIEQLFTNRLDANAHTYFAGISALRVSAHFLIARTGELTQFVPVHRRAWHAGNSRFQGRSACNDFSIGIELEGTDDTPFSAVQYRTLEHLARCLSGAIPTLAAGAAVGHADIAPGRKRDPGPGFDWGQVPALRHIDASP